MEPGVCAPTLVQLSTPRGSQRSASLAALSSALEALSARSSPSPRRTTRRSGGTPWRPSEGSSLRGARGDAGKDKLRGPSRLCPSVV